MHSDASETNSNNDKQRQTVVTKNWSKQENYSIQIKCNETLLIETAMRWVNKAMNGLNYGVRYLGMSDSYVEDKVE